MIVELFVFFIAFCHADNQTLTYVANHGHATITNAQLTMSSFFSPDTSIDVFTQLVESANSTIDISTPGWNSWSGCTPRTPGKDGCPVAFVRNSEEFPVFQAVLNAIHRGVKVRILTNDFGSRCGPGLITPLDFLTLAGAQTTAFATLTFLHTKWLSVDSSRSIISSVNYDYTSFMENREAGFLLEGAAAKPLIAFMEKLYNLDISVGLKWPLSKYNASDMAIIRDPSPVPVVIPPPKVYKKAYVSKVTRVTETVNTATVMSNPDDAWSIISNALSSATTSISIYIYQITDDTFSNLLINAYNNGITIKLLVSDRIYSTIDWKAATKVYDQLKAAGITVRKFNKYIYEFEHNKFWIIDGTKLYLSSGNMGETDFPDGSNVFPPPSNSNWRRTNRDHTIVVDEPNIAAAYQTVLDEDYKLGYDY